MVESNTKRYEGTALCTPMRVRTLKLELLELNDAAVEVRRLSNIINEALGIKLEPALKNGIPSDDNPDMITRVNKTKDIVAEAIDTLNGILEFIG